MICDNVLLILSLVAHRSCLGPGSMRHDGWDSGRTASSITPAISLLCGKEKKNESFYQ